MKNYLGCKEQLFIFAFQKRRDGRVAEGAGLLNRCSVLGRYRGFESLSLRNPEKALL